MPLAARLVEVVSPRDIRDQVGRPYCQEHEDHGRIDYWSGGEAKEARACSDHDKLEPAPPKKNADAAKLSTATRIVRRASEGTPRAAAECPLHAKAVAAAQSPRRG
jgi:hypothetical protein